MPIKIASWNCSLGLIGKIEIVKTILNENQIDILFIQEAEITPTTPINQIGINGYNLELSPTYGQQKSRTCCFIKNKIKYSRASEIENNKLELIMLKTVDNMICGYYRPFLHPSHQTEKQYIEETVECLSKINNKNLIIAGDFNIDFMKIHQQSYKNRLIYEILEVILIEKALVQVIKKPTWMRKYKNNLKESLLDHIYVSDISSVQDHFNEQQVVGDHNLIGIILKCETNNFPRHFPTLIQDWTNYSIEKLTNKLSGIDFTILDKYDAETHNSELNQLLGEIIDELVPVLKINRKEVPGFISIKHIRQKRRRRNLFKKFKKTGNPIHLQRARELEKNIKKDISVCKREKIRRKIKPGDSKSLWQAVSLSINNFNGVIPEKVAWKDEEAEDDQEKADLFCKFFNNKTNTIIKNNPYNRSVYNGRKLINNTLTNPFTIDEVIKILKEIPIKNCSGYDRVPLRVFNDGKYLLAPTILSLMNKIWHTEAIPEIWKMTKTQPLHKSGNKSNVENYRPISNLCSLSKIFEKLIQLKLDQTAKLNNIDLTNPSQHGFKKKHSTITAMLEIQNKISNAIDNNDFSAMISLDLSAAFDVVDHSLLIKRLRTLNLPNKIVNLLEAWLKNRNMYVSVNNSCSIFTDILAGTLQGSCLGPILFALFISPMYEISDCITYADDNYTIESGKDLNDTIGKVKMKAELLIQWLKDSGMQVNSKKTEFCIFHRNDVPQRELKLFNEIIQSKKEIKILGVTFDSKLSWSSHINITLLKCRKTLQAIKIISKYFTIDEKINIVTSLFYSKMYYGSEIWLIPTLKSSLKHKLFRLSTQALKIASEDIYNVFGGNELHLLFKRFTPHQMTNYISLLNLYRLMNNKIPEMLWIQMQFNSHPLTRANKTLITPSNKVKVGLNSLSNRLSYPSTLVTNDDLNKEYPAFKILAKKIALNT